MIRAVARSENPGGHIVLGGDNVPPLVEIGLTDLPKAGGRGGGGLRPPSPLACNSPDCLYSKIRYSYSLTSILGNLKSKGEALTSNTRKS